MILLFVLFYLLCLLPWMQENLKYNKRSSGLLYWILKESKDKKPLGCVCVQSQGYPLEGAGEEFERSCAYFSFVTVSLFWGPSALAAWGTLLALNRDREGTFSLRYPRERMFVIYTALSHFQIWEIGSIRFLSVFGNKAAPPCSSPFPLTLQ